eukprot:8242941-Alexandrium_andersonii.AAC.1
MARALAHRLHTKLNTGAWLVTDALFCTIVYARAARVRRRALITTLVCVLASLWCYTDAID